MENPGLEKYFPSLDLIEVGSRPGFIDMLLYYKDTLTRGFGEDDFPLEPVTSYLLDVNDYEQLLLITAGKRDDQYISKVRSFDWFDFYQSWQGELYFKWMRKEFLQIADIVLVNIPDGISDVGKVCVYQFADVVVLFCLPNQQSLDSTYRTVTDFS